MATLFCPPLAVRWSVTLNVPIASPTEGVDATHETVPGSRMAKVSGKPFDVSVEVVPSLLVAQAITLPSALITGLWFWYEPPEPLGVPSSLMLARVVGPDGSK